MRPFSLADVKLPLWANYPLGWDRCIPPVGPGQKPNYLDLRVPLRFAPVEVLALSRVSALSL